MGAETRGFVHGSAPRAGERRLEPTCVTSKGRRVSWRASRGFAEVRVAAARAVMVEIIVKRILANRVRVRVSSMG
jgi:hypothetical protein